MTRETERSFNGKLYLKCSHLKLLESDNFSSYNRKCQKWFFQTQCRLKDIQRPARALIMSALPAKGKAIDEMTYYMLSGGALS